MSRCVAPLPSSTARFGNTSIEIGVATSTTHYIYSEKTYTDSTLKGYPSSQEEQADLAAGRVDAINDDISVIEEWLKTPDGACCKIVGAITPVPEIHGPGAGIAVRKGETELVNQFNAAIDMLKKSVAANPALVGAQLLLGDTLANTGRFAEAIAAYDRVLRYAPENEDARGNRDRAVSLMPRP